MVGRIICPVLSTPFYAEIREEDQFDHKRKGIDTRQLSSLFILTR
jgi:hypothetical protein